MTTISGVGTPPSAAAAALHAPDAACACRWATDVNTALHSLHSSVGALHPDPVLAAPGPTRPRQPDMPTAVVDLICLLVTAVGIAVLRRQHQ